MDPKKTLLKVQTNGIYYVPAPIHVLKLQPTAEDPSKEKASDVGWTITLIGRQDNRVEDIVNEVNTFTTGLIINPPDRYHIELIADENLYKSGYMLVTGLTVLNPSSNSELIIPLFKFKEAEDIELPFRGVQIILRETEYAHLMPIKQKLDEEDEYPKIRKKKDDDITYLNNNKKTKSKKNHYT